LYLINNLKSLAMSSIIVIFSVIYYRIGFTLFINTYINNGITLESLITLLISVGLLCIVSSILIRIVQVIILKRKKTNKLISPVNS